MITQQEQKRPIKVNYPIMENLDDKQYQVEVDKLTEEAFINADTTRTIKNIKETLINNLRKKYRKTNGELKNITDEILKIHGIHENNFDFTNSFSKFITNKLADVSIDDNANKGSTSIRGILKEMELTIDKIIGYDMLYRTMKELYGQTEAKKLSGEMYDLSLGLSDSSNIMIPYCWSLDASKLVTIGRDFGTLPSKPSKRVSSYVAALCETIHQLTSHLAGAIAIGTFFLDVAHLLIYKQRIPLFEFMENKYKRKNIENEFQQFVHSVNFLSRNSVESPFTNISIFDKEKLRNLISDENYGWYFPKKTQVLVDNNLGGEDYKLDEKDYKEFVIDYIFELQKLFVDYFDKGDPANNGLPYRFPVCTINLSTKLNENGKEYLEKDNELFNYIIKKDISKYNIYAASGTKIASCCRLLSNKDMLDLGSTVNSFGGSSVSLGSHRVITLNLARIALETTNYDKYKKILEERIEDTAKILKAHRILLLKLKDLGLQPFLKNGWININRMFSTFGIMGIVEANDILKQTNDKDFDYLGDILKFINTKTDEFAKKYEFIHNIEQIPGESFAVRLAKADRLLFGNPYNLYDLYANQNIPLWKDCTIYEKMDADGKYNKLFTGGGIAHIQIDGSVTPTQAKNIINYAVESGCAHFALNSIYSKCTKCSETYKGKVVICPNCKNEGFDYFTRVVGFFTPVKNWNSVRRDTEFKDRKFISLKELEEEKLI